MIYQELYCQGKAALEAAGVLEAALDARLLLEKVCGTDRNDLLVRGDRKVEAEAQRTYLELIARRSERIPLQYLTGMQNFMGLDFVVDRNVLIPRQDTEILVEEVLKNLHDGMRILDVCTGSGCILISLLHYSNNCQGVGADISMGALDMARRNAGRLLGNRFLNSLDDVDGFSAEGGGFGGIRFVESDLFENIDGKFDIIVSNPPYISSGVIGTLMPEVRDHEPVLALDGGADGLSLIRRIIGEGRLHLSGGGMLFLEIGCDQGEETAGMMRQAGFLEVAVVKDYAGLDRVVYGTLGFA